MGATGLVRATGAAAIAKARAEATTTAATITRTTTATTITATTITAVMGAVATIRACLHREDRGRNSLQRGLRRTRKV
jgi:hypothetical protein